MSSRRVLLDQNLHAWDIALRARIEAELDCETLTADELGLARASDAQILEHAVREGMTIFTHDKDFGELVVRYAQANCGVLLFRLWRLGREGQAEWIASNLVREGLPAAGELWILDHVRLRKR